MATSLQLVVTCTGDGVSGTVSADERRIAFSGWLELAAAIRTLTAS